MVSTPARKAGDAGSIPVGAPTKFSISGFHGRNLLLSSHRGEEKALSQFWQGSGPVTSCIHACSGSDRHVIPLEWGITKITHKQIHILKTGNNSVWFSDREVFNRESEYTSSLYRRSDVTPGGSSRYSTQKITSRHSATPAPPALARCMVNLNFVGSNKMIGKLLLLIYLRRDWNNIFLTCQTVRGNCSIHFQTDLSWKSRYFIEYLKLLCCF